MNEIYKQAIEEANGRRPIFLVNISLYKTTRHGNSTKVSKTYASAEKLVCGGTIVEMKKSRRVLLQCLTQISGKANAHKADLTKYVIDEIEVISFHGYSIKHE